MDLQQRESENCLGGSFSSDAGKVRRLRGEVNRATGLGTLFKALSDETRAKIMYCLLHEECCASDVTLILGMSAQAVSHHLRLLRAMRLVKYRREGKLAFYSLDDAHVASLIAEGLAHVHEGEKPEAGSRKSEVRSRKSEAGSYHTPDS